MLATIGGKQQSPVPMRRPILPEQFERRSGQWNVAILDSFTSMDMNHASFRVDVTDL